jgi:hypothetical protein
LNLKNSLYQYGDDDNSAQKMVAHFASNKPDSRRPRAALTTVMNILQVHASTKPAPSSPRQN